MAKSGTLVNTPDCGVYKAPATAKTSGRDLRNRGSNLTYRPNKITYRDNKTPHSLFWLSKSGWLTGRLEGGEKINKSNLQNQVSESRIKNAEFPYSHK